MHHKGDVLSACMHQKGDMLSACMHQKGDVLSACMHQKGDVLSACMHQGNLGLGLGPEVRRRQQPPRAPAVGRGGVGAGDGDAGGEDLGEPAARVLDLKRHAQP
jgi:hypothetical protein